MVRFARTGGEANSIATRIARAASGKDNVAICGYHGWHDWYLAANIGDDKHLSEHLLPGLNPNGVPNSLRGTSFTFEYNNFDQLKKVVDQNDIGIIQMEVMRNFEPKNNFLQKVRELANEKNIILIFDECTSGFRSHFGGLHKKYKVEPDIAVFGKAMGNGYAITAVIGKKEIMNFAQDTFISSTFWTERIGSAAALETLSVMEEIKSWEILSTIGNKIIKKLEEMGSKHELPIKIFGTPEIIKFSFNSENNLAYKSLITQEMLNYGFLATNAIYVCTEHHDSVLESYFHELDKVFKIISDCENGLDVFSLLRTSVCHSEFKRLN
jgi:glutamate-1-semialdehyde 2,1-aminomutase